MEANRYGKYISLSRNSPLQEHVYAAWAGGEAHADQKRGCARIVDMMAAVIGDGGLHIQTAQGEAMIKCEFVIGGDYPWLASSMGLAGHMSTHPCIWCEVHKDKLGVWRESELDQRGFAELRTPARQRAWAHLGGYCPTCRKNYSAANHAAATAEWNSLSKTAFSPM